MEETIFFSSTHLWRFLTIPTLLSMAVIALARLCVQPNKALRKTITSNRLWKLQFLCHPIIVAGILMASSLPTEKEETTSSFVIMSFATLSVLFAFNFGVEPFDVPNDMMFSLCFYLHHYAVVVASAIMLSFPTEDDGNHNTKFSFGLSQAILLGHAWLLHPVAYLDTKQIIDKQAIFLPYIATGFICMLYWWSQDGDVIIPKVFRLPVAMQYMGRWGLYVRLCLLTGWHKPDHPNHDSFEWRKQYYELLSFALAFMVSTLWRYW
ncbi:expressed unknown protein [Seminavis robusta]|uniref:Uncharacterized protein n=1 Tax=Seminavis robusta TaxID=568900 RepID=A0A9N8H0R8_9STRA|nr:expressed unknown protein [Seminavis robusta]|eukprot:Sro25_g017260.1 n/a (265) ;mRNA; f:140472-141266